VHVLTKVFVVIAALLSILLAGMVIVHTSNTDKVRADYQAELARRLATDSALQTASAQGGSEKSRLMDQIQQAQNDRNELQQQMTNLASERSKLLADLNRALAEKTTSESKIGELTETARTQSTLIASMREELGTIRGSETSSRKKLLDAEDRINDLTSKNDVLTQNIRALQEELAERNRALQVAGTQAASGAAGLVSGSAPQPFVYSGPRIVGRVESVSRDSASGRTLAKITVGSNDRVSNNMLLRIVRDNEFVANLVVSNTDLSFSVGAVDFLGRSVDVREGDMVVSRIN
jgi:septal ring factor EnvC (AmiA/AmiB activator)